MTLKLAGLLSVAAGVAAGVAVAITSMILVVDATVTGIALVVAFTALGFFGTMLIARAVERSR